VLNELDKISYLFEIKKFSVKKSFIFFLSFFLFFTVLVGLVKLLFRVLHLLTEI